MRGLIYIKGEIIFGVGVIVAILVIIMIFMLLEHLFYKKKHKKAIVKLSKSNYVSRKSVYVEMSKNRPYFSFFDKVLLKIKFSELDSLKRPGVATAILSIKTMPKEERESISHIKPLGFEKQMRYRHLTGEHLFNRCHLIGHQLIGDLGGKLNIITGTRAFNTDGMLEFENKVAKYLKKNKKNKVLYRVTPVYYKNNILVKGVLIEALSFKKKDICFNVFIYNTQGSVKINYKTGDSEAIIKGIKLPKAVKFKLKKTVKSSKPKTSKSDNKNDVKNSKTNQVKKPTIKTTDKKEVKNKVEKTVKKEAPKKQVSKTLPTSKSRTTKTSAPKSKNTTSKKAKKRVNKK